MYRKGVISLTCKYFKYLSEYEAQCLGPHYPEELLDSEHYYEHCKYNDCSNRTDCVFFPDKTKHRRCFNCHVILQEDDIYCVYCGSRQLEIE